MTWITDNSGTRWVEPIPRKRRKPARALRFADLEVGQQLMRRPKADWYRKIPQYYLVTDRWFDPVAGQTDPVAGQMVALCIIKSDGETSGRKSGTTLRGLASQQYEYADMDYLLHCRARRAGMGDGKVVGIGVGSAIRKRPKLPGGL